MPLKILTQKSFTGGHQHCPHFAVGNAQAQSNGVTLIQRQVQSPPQGSTVVSKAYRKPKIKASFVPGSPPKFYVTLRLDDYCISFTFDSSEFIKHSQGLKRKKNSYPAYTVSTLCCNTVLQKWVGLVWQTCSHPWLHKNQP